MLTKAIIQSIDYTKNMCRVRIPLFENASRNINMIEADAQFNIVPGIYNSYKTGDIVFIGFEENKMELPVILGKLFVSASVEANSLRGNLSGNALVITEAAQLPYSTTFNYEQIAQNNSLYSNLNTPKKLADSILALQHDTQVQKYQTTIRVQLNESTTCALYIKTTADYTYSQESSEEPIYKLFTALQESQVNNLVIPLDLAILEGTSQVSPAALQVCTLTPDNLQFKIIINGNSYDDITKSNILDIQSAVIYY